MNDTRRPVPFPLRSFQSRKLYVTSKPESTRFRLSCKLCVQVMTALREGRTSTSGMANGSSTPMAATPRGATPRANGRGGYAVAESVQQALLYVRFRTAAEAGLKGDFAA